MQTALCTNEGLSMSLLLSRMIGLGLIVAALGACASAQDDATGEPAPFGDINADLSAEDLERLVQETTAPTSPVEMSLAEARAQLPFVFGLLAWAPEGFVLQDAVEVVLPSDSSTYAAVIVTWLNAEEDALTLRASPTTSSQPQLAGSGNTETVLVNGQPATLTRSTRADHERLTLSWEREGVKYTLSGERGVVTVDELVGMAEAVQP